jgi:carboxylesterase
MTLEIVKGQEPFSSPGGPFGVLVLHGFTAGPATMRSLALRAAGAGYTVELPLLPGHGTTIEDLTTKTWSDWSGAALASFDELAARCARVAVVGLSMGGGLSTLVAEERPVVGSVLINPIVTSPGEADENAIDQFIDAGLEVVDGIGSDLKNGGDGFAYAGTPMRSLKTLIEGIKTVHAGLSRITAPTLLIVSREDHVVYWNNCDDYMASVTGPTELVWLEDSYHVATLDNDRELVESATMEFLATVFS